MTYDPSDRKDVFHRASVYGHDLTLFNRRPDEIKESVSGNAYTDYSPDGGSFVQSATAGDSIKVSGMNEYWVLNGPVQYDYRVITMTCALDRRTPLTDICRIGIGAKNQVDRGLYIDFENEKIVDGDAETSYPLENNIFGNSALTATFIQDIGNGSTVSIRSRGLSQTETFNNVRDREPQYIYTESNGEGHELRVAAIKDAIGPKDAVIQ